MRTLAIVLAGGAGKRMGAATNKQFLLIDNKPIIAHTLQIFEDCRSVRWRISGGESEGPSPIQEEILEQYRFNKVLKLVIGGRLRQDSVRNGIEAIEKPCDIVLSMMGHDRLSPPHLLKKVSV